MMNIRAPSSGLCARDVIAVTHTLDKILCKKSSLCAHFFSGLAEICTARLSVLTRMATITRACSACSLIMSTQPDEQNDMSAST
eukprot:2190738-Prymnesium_polylepis.2